MKKYIDKIIFYSIITFLLIVSTHSYVLINLKKYKNDNNSITGEYSPELLIKNLYNQYYSYLNVGYPPQKTEAQLSVDYVGIAMKENICLTSNFYNKNKSLTLEQIHYYDDDDYQISKEWVVANETIDIPFFNSSTKNVSLNTIPYIFIYYKANKSGEKEEKIEKEKEGKACILLGLSKYCQYGLPYCTSMPNYLKGKKLINSYNFFFLYNSDKEKKEKEGDDISLLIGENPHEYNNKEYDINNYIKSPALPWISEPSWTLEFKNFYYLSNGSEINFHTSSINDRIKGTFVFNLDIIIGIRDYFRSIKTNYFDNYQKECNINIVDSQYTVITCDKNFNTEKFPTLYFYHMDYNYTFELTHKDLFQIIGDKKYFLIIFDSTSNFPWKFGKLFMQKYLFNFDTDSSMIGFYRRINNENNESNENNGKNEISENISNSNFLVWIFMGILIIIFGIGCFCLGKFLYNKNRKKRANELEDDYEYKQKNNEESLTNNKNKNILGIN